ncbi:hypothetical protein E4U54_006239 [Claviceps lovelessii]|nr:hypothetical protein E4U54_006239 [Claviceps lovelessii]
MPSCCSSEPTRHESDIASQKNRFLTTWLVRAKDCAIFPRDDNYTCSVLVNAHILRRALGTRYRLLTMLYDGISPAMRDTLVEHNMTVFMAPTAYWLSNSNVHFRPSTVTWERIKTAGGNMTSGEYEMDLMNNLLTPQAYHSQHWEDYNVPWWYQAQSRDRRALSCNELRNACLHDQVSILHCTTVAKPWTIEAAELQGERSNAHPLLVQQWRT